ncbi:MAG: hypothetical protein VX496_07480, partial [Planctomycetota bacterium]|nr:hypothetical protein [Planctomycetota bacterium]
LHYKKLGKQKLIDKLDKSEPLGFRSSKKDSDAEDAPTAEQVETGDLISSVSCKGKACDIIFQPGMKYRKTTASRGKDLVLGDIEFDPEAKIDFYFPEPEESDVNDTGEGSEEGASEPSDSEPVSAASEDDDGS